MATLNLLLHQPPLRIFSRQASCHFHENLFRAFIVERFRLNLLPPPLPQRPPRRYFYRCEVAVAADALVVSLDHLRLHCL